MPNSIDRDLAALFVICREYYLQNSSSSKPKGELYEEICTTLTDVLSSMATIHSRLYSGWRADKNHPGYLLKIEPPMVLRAPYHVLPTFPSGDELEELWHLSRAIRSDDRSVISISGSNVLRKIFDLVGDVDFCEYLTIGPYTQFDRLARNLDGTEHIACLRVVLGDREWFFPWNADKPTKELFWSELDSNDDKRSSIKVDYVGAVKNFGVTEVTNVVIATDNAGRSAALRRTFAAQEAPLVPIDWLPNQMNDPVEMGRYIYWLEEAIKKLRGSEASKCLKRCASLSRVLFLPQTTDDIARLVAKSRVLLHGKITQIGNLKQRLSALPDERSNRLVEKLEGHRGALEAELTELGGRPDDLERRRFAMEVNRIAQRLLSWAQSGDDPDSRRAA